MKYLEDSCVDCSKLQISSEGDSPVNVIVIQKNGDRNFINSGIPEAADFTPDPGQIEGVKVVSFASLFTPPFTDAGKVLATARKAKEAGAITCMDVIVRPDSRLEDYREAFRYIDYIFPNREEAELLTGRHELFDMAGVFLDYGVKNVIIKIGKDGCYVRNQDGADIVPGYMVPDVVDTTGAGDNFAAGFISGLLQEKSLKECCRYACGIAGVSIRYQGGCTGVQSRQQAEEEIRRMEEDAK